MFVLCDTSSILMLLRIAPEMFVDERFECVTVKVVHDEIVQKTKFKSKYPWTREIRGKLKIIYPTKSQKDLIDAFFAIIRDKIIEGTINKISKNEFDLSFPDQKIAASTLALEHKMSSGDRGLVAFCKQVFPKEFKGAVTSLELINLWIEKGLIKWDDTKQQYLSDWNKNNEIPQPHNAKVKFKQLTGRKYEGS